MSLELGTCLSFPKTGRFIKSTVFAGKSGDQESTRANGAQPPTSGGTKDNQVFAQCSRRYLQPIEQCFPVLARRNTAWSSNAHLQTIPCWLCGDISQYPTWRGASGQPQPEILGTALSSVCFTACPHQNQATTDLIMRKYLLNKEKIFRRDSISFLPANNTSCQYISLSQTSI